MLQANNVADFTAAAAARAAAHLGVYFVIDNPQGSLFFHYAPVKALLEATQAERVTATIPATL